MDILSLLPDFVISHAGEPRYSPASPKDALRSMGIRSSCSSPSTAIRGFPISGEVRLLNNSVIILDKPDGPSSHEVTTYVKKLLGAARAGHAGTLDPNVCGVLPIALGRATKLLRYITGKKKTYVGIIRFKEILPAPEIEKLFASFTGEIIQTPPRESAVRKIPRKRTIYRLQLLELDGRFALFETEVDAGTYIRTLCEDIGRRCGGAKMHELRRIAVGNVHESQAVRIHDLIDAVWVWKNKDDPSLLAPMLHAPEAFIDFKRITIKESAIPSILNGAPVALPALASYPDDLIADEYVSLYDAQNRFIGVGKALFSAQDIGQKTRGIVVKPERIHYQK